MRFVNGPRFAATWLALQKIGAIGVGKSDAFSDEQIALLQTFADQAVIAV